MPIHTGISDFEYNSPACYGCHPRGEGSIDHRAFFPIEDGSAHGDVGCGECHATLQVGNYAENRCADCHRNTLDEDLDIQHTLVAEFDTASETMSSQTCKRCHADSQVESVVDHKPFLIRSTGNFTAPHASEKCLDCHTSNRTDKPYAADFEQRTCLTCHLEPDMNLTHGPLPAFEYATPSCITCHPDGSKDVEVDHEDTFPLAAPAAHSEISCAECHVVGSSTQNQCLQCHAEERAENLPSLHGDVGEFRADQPAVNSQGCKKCHAESQVEPVADHGDFLISNGTGHHRQNCLECHASTRPEKAWAADFTKRSCLSCHLEPDMTSVHGPLPAYEYNTPSCLTCHPNGSKDVDIDHSASFPIAAPAAHSEISCAECHTAGSATENQCLRCHAEERAEDLPALHGDVGEFQPGMPAVDSQGCKRCHAESQVKRVDDHGDFLVKPGNEHHLESCLDCHTSSRVDKDWATDFTKRTCLGCHLAPETNATHGGIPDYVYATVNCLTCHPSGGAATDIDHSPFFPIQAGTPHAEINCGGCHVSTTDRTQNLCQTCHADVEGQDLPLIHTDVGEFSNGQIITSTDCKTCHADAQVDPIAQHAFLIQDGAAHNRENCLECHSSNRTDKTWAADFAKNECTTCHQNGETTLQHSGVNDFVFATVNCLQCHPDGTVGANIDHEPIFPIGTGTAHQGVSCSECHLAADRSVNGCQQCHATESDIAADHSAARAPNNNWGSVNSTQCKQCHADSQVHTVNGHTPFSIRNNRHRRTCTACHKSTRQDKPWGIDFDPFTCSQCHSRNEMDDKHRNRNGYSYNDHNTCIECHQNG